MTYMVMDPCIKCKFMDCVEVCPGVAAELHVTETGPHGSFMGSAPEDAEIMAECRRFICAAWGVAA